VTPRTCRVERVRLFRFRNYADERVELGPGLNVVSGANAQGKTNLLEALATLALTRSPRAASAAELITWGESACRLEARLQRPDGPTSLDVRVERGAAGQVDGEEPVADRAVRRTLVDGKERAARSLLGLCPVVLFWPEDLLLVKGGPDGRRRLLDVVLSQLDPRIAVELLRYRHVLEQRNALLRQLRGYGRADATLSAFTEELTRSGGAIRVARHRLARALSPLAATAHAELSDGGEALSLRYVGGDAQTDSIESAAAELAAELGQRSAEELARGVTVAGPHRDDIEFLLDARPARTTASQGQQRSVVLACKLAEVRHVAEVAGMAPVLLLDDVLSELDAERRRRLLHGLGAGAPSQTLLTTTETAPLDLGDSGGEVHRLLVHQGHVVHVGDRGTVVPT
jgi:DNA replication and repair protein RecF